MIECVNKASLGNQLELFAAEPYIADGDNFVFATANTGLFARVEIALRSAEYVRLPRKPSRKA